MLVNQQWKRKGSVGTQKPSGVPVLKVKLSFAKKIITVTSQTVKMSANM